jgi:hypothetical protein
MVIAFNSAHDRTLHQIQDGRIAVTAEDWPAFLYDDTPYDPQNEELGLFRGFLLLQVRIYALNSILLRHSNH